MNNILTKIFLLLLIIFSESPSLKLNSLEYLNNIFNKFSFRLSETKKFSNNFIVVSFTSFKGIEDISFKIISPSSLENSGNIRLRRVIILLLIDCDLDFDIFHKKDICSFLKILFLYKNTIMSFERSIKAS